MCSAPDIPEPVMPPERAAMRAPDRAGARANTSQRVTDRMRSATSTILTSGSGVTATGSSDKKTLLGQ
ncbi:MAG TPA: hypothetical protein VIG24_14545 [Acidimicrobiia bacterium]